MFIPLNFLPLLRFKFSTNTNPTSSPKHSFIPHPSLLSKYSVQNKCHFYLDQLISHYKSSPTRINPQTIHYLLNNIDVTVFRRQDRFYIVKQMFKDLVHHFKINFQSYNQRHFSTLVFLYNAMNLHQAQLFQLTQNNLFNENKPHFKQFLKIYTSIVDLHHDTHPKLKNHLKNYIFQAITHHDFLLNYPNDSNPLLFSMKFLSALMMDSEFDHSQCQVLIDSIVKNIFPKVPMESLADVNVAKNYALVKELITYHKLKISNDKLIQFLDSAVTYTIENKYRIAKPARSETLNPNRKERDFERFEENHRLEVEGQKIKRRGEHGAYGKSSVFETKFQRHLDKLGYEYEKNVLIGIYEYDVLLTGRKARPYLPFASLSSNTKPQAITPSQLESFRRMNDMNLMSVNERWKEPVILGLQGPHHYIESDVYGGGRMTRTDDVKGMLVMNYGYGKIKEVNYWEWEEVDERGVMVEDFIERLVGQVEVAEQHTES